MGIERFITEYWRTDPKYILGFLSEAQAISIILFLSGLSLIIYVNRFKKYPEKTPEVEPKKE